MAIKISNTPTGRYWAFKKLSGYKQRQKLAIIEGQLAKQQAKLEGLAVGLPHDSSLATKLREYKLEFSPRKNRTLRYIDLKMQLKELKEYGKDIDIPFITTAEKIKIKAFADILTNSRASQAFKSEGNYETQDENIANAIKPYIWLLKGVKPQNMDKALDYINNILGENITPDMINSARNGLNKRLELRRSKLGR